MPGFDIHLTLFNIMAFFLLSYLLHWDGVVVHRQEGEDARKLKLSNRISGLLLPICLEPIRRIRSMESHANARHFTFPIPISKMFEL